MIFHSKTYDWGIRKSSFSTYQCSLFLRGVSEGPCFCLWARRCKHEQCYARPRDGLKAGPALTPPNNRLSSGRAMISHEMNIDMLSKKWYFVTKIVLTYCEKNCFSDREKLLKLKAKGREFANF